MPPIRTVSLCLLLLAGLIGNARAADSGIARIERAQAAMDASGGPSQLLQTAFVATGRSDRLDGAVSGNGWWRVHPAPGSGDRALLVFHPYSAHVTVLMAPDFRPQVQTLFDANLDARYSRRALVFPLHGDGVVYIGVDQARYPLQVAVQDVRTHAVSDRNHLKVLYSATGVLVGVCLVALVFFLVLRDRVYLLYAGCMAMQLMYVLCAYGEAYALPGLRGLARFGAPGIWFVATVSTIVSVYFLLEFGGLRARTPWLSRALTVVGAWLPMLLLALLVAPWPQDKHWFPGLGNLSLLLANLLAILALGLAWRRGSRHAGMMLLAWIPLVAVSTARAAAQRRCAAQAVARIRIAAGAGIHRGGADAGHGRPHARLPPRTRPRPARGRARPAHRRLQPRRHQAPAGLGAGRDPVRIPAAGGAVPGHRPLQADQRRTRPRRR